MRPTSARSTGHLRLDIAFQDARDLRGIPREIHAVDVAGPGKGNRKLLTDPSGMGGEEDDAIAETDGFSDVMRDEHDRLAVLAPDALDVAVELFPGQGIQCAE